MMIHERAIVLTSINPPTRGIEMLRERLEDWTMVVVGDRKTPPNWSYPDVTYLSVEEQAASCFALAPLLPFDHYSRKNLGYLFAVSHGAGILAETDDDNLPYGGFLKDVAEVVEARTVLETGWANIYTAFTDSPIWPRGFPLERILDSLSRPLSVGEAAAVRCPIQQFLADGDPDVDAVYRLTHAADVQFRAGRLAVGRGTYCPFNSQNTVWWPSAYDYLYLPSFVSFRMTDIWRSFVAHRCIAEDGASVAFCGPTVYQDRNRHSLLRDFEDEVPGYLSNESIVDLLWSLDLAGLDAGERLSRCYEALVGDDHVPPEELPLVEAWIADLSQARRARSLAP